LEYLEEFLLGASEMSSLSHIQERLVARKKKFEIEKNRAVGRGRPFMKTLEEAHILTGLCSKMARQLGLVGPHLMLSAEGESYLKADPTAKNRILTVKMVETYERFRQLLRALDQQETKELNVPVEKIPTRDFEKYLKVSGAKNFARIYFETVMDLATQLGLVNWFVETKTLDARMWVLYLACSITTSQANSFKDDTPINELPVNLGHETWNIQFSNPPHEEFCQVLWRNYLELTKYVARKPVFYSNLRSKVCYSLRVSDTVFDNYAQKIMSGDSKFRLVGAGGTLPFSRDSASLLKSIPPKTDRGEYVVYLKMDRRN